MVVTSGALAGGRLGSFGLLLPGLDEEPSAEAQATHLRSFTFLGDYPKDRNSGWHSEAQGVTNDARNWFITQRGTLWKFPRSFDLNTQIGGHQTGVIKKALQNVPLPEIEIPLFGSFPVYNHFGDLDYFDGYLYVPVEADESDKKIPLVAAFDAGNLAFRWCAKLSAQGSSAHYRAPWCAINPVNGLLYSSSNSIDSDRGPIRVYRRDPSPAPGSSSGTKVLQKVRDFRLYAEDGRALSLQRLQGGTFSSNGNLYLVIDTEEGGIMGFNPSGRRILHTPIRYVRGTGEELEGITIWDLDAGGAPGVRGQIHVLMIDNDTWTEDDLYFKHFRVQSGDLARL
jgi:hypothetical protein